MAIEDDIAVLERVPTFAVLGREALRILAIGAESRYVHGGEVLFAIGDSADAAYLVREGSFMLKTSPTQPDTQATIAGPGALLGEFALLTETTRPASAIAREPSNVLRIPRSLFVKMLEGFPDAAVRLRRQVAGRLAQTTRDIRQLRDAIDPGGKH